MTDRRVVFLSALGFLVLVAGLVVLAMPDPYEGGEVYVFDNTHSVRALDVVGVLLTALGGATVWGAGMLWQRRMTQ
jgi:drug/metabolite transporter (DMT)-like permease